MTSCLSNSPTLYSIFNYAVFSMLPTLTVISTSSSHFSRILWVCFCCSDNNWHYNHLFFSSNTYLILLDRIIYQNISTRHRNGDIYYRDIFSFVLMPCPFTTQAIMVLHRFHSFNIHELGKIAGQLPITSSAIFYLLQSNS